MEYFSQELLNEFASHFPIIDFSGITTGYDLTEKRLCPHVLEFSKEQWETILDRKYDYLFQKGTAHVSWRCDREDIIFELLDRRNIKPYLTYSETWYDVEKYSLMTPTGVCLEVKIERSRTFSSRDHYHLKICDKVTPVPTHRAIIIQLSNNTKAYISDQYAGTLSDCENWISSNLGSGQCFKIIPIE